MKLLRGFAKVALAPGETKTVPLDVPVSELAWYDPDAAAWEVERMEHSVLVGPSSRREDLLEASFRVVGDRSRLTVGVAAGRLAPNGARSTKRPELC